MDTIHQPPDTDPPPGPTPYFTARAEAVRRAVEQAETWYAGGLPPEPRAA